MSEILIQHAITILILLLWLLVVTGDGLFCLKALSIDIASRKEELFLSAGIGLIVVGYGVFLLGVTHCLYPFSLAALFFSLAAISVSGWLRPPRYTPTAAAFKSNGLSGAGILLLALSGVILVMGFLLSLTPEIGKDALIYHLAVPKLFLQHHGFYTIPGNIFAHYPLLAEMNYLPALFLQNDILAKMMNYAVLCLIILGIGLFARLALKDLAFPALSILIFLSIPSVFAVSHTAYNDLFVSLFTLAAFYCFLRWPEEASAGGWLILFGIFSGAAAACKYTALLIIPLGCLGILFFAHKNKYGVHETIRSLIVYAVAALVVGSPFYLKNLLVTGNPFFPFLYGIFGGTGWDANQARLYDLFVQNLGMGRDLGAYLLLPWNLSFHAKMDSIAFDGVIGPVFLLILPFLAFVRRGTSLFLISGYSFFSFLFWASSAQQIRYLIPLFPLLAVAVGGVLNHYRKQKLIFYFLIAAVSGSLLLNGSYIARDFLKIAPLRVVAGIESRGNFLTRLVPTYPMYRFVNEKLPPQAKVFMIYMKNYTFFCKRDCYSDSMFETHTLVKILRTAAAPEAIEGALKKEGFTHIMYDERYLTSTFSPLSAEEIKRFQDYRNRYLRPVIKMGPYRLYGLSL